jgi:epsilon-lactone hydrolase
MKTKIDAGGTVHVENLSLPVSDFASAGAKEKFTRLRAEEPPYYKEFASGNIEKLRRSWDEHNAMPALDRAKMLFPVDIKSTCLGGINADMVTPVGGVPAYNARRLLINLHGGGFIAGAGATALLEAIPIAHVGNIEVITLDYRLAPEHTFPAASVDIAAAYEALLTQYQPDHIGIYGCSAGGTLAAQAVAWFDRHGLPAPGAIAMICSNAARMGTGDSTLLGRAFGVSVPPPAKLRWYFDGSNPNNPLVSPCASPELLARFPPTLLISTSRDFFLSHTTHMHLQLTKAGAESHLCIWDGLWHGFVWQPDLPESREAYEIISKFFDRNLGHE